MIILYIYKEIKTYHTSSYFVHKTLTMILTITILSVFIRFRVVYGKSIFYQYLSMISCPKN